MAFATAIGDAATAQQPQAAKAYPEHDILSPFRVCEEISAPPDRQFEHLRVMLRIARDLHARASHDEQGREIIDDAQWQEHLRALEELGLDPGHLAVLMRQSRKADDRAVAFYAMFFCNNPAHVFNLISHIPGEPVRATREEAYPRAIAYLKAQLTKTYGDLTPEQQQALDLPEPGSPRARTLGITRAPRDSDLLFSINLKPFFQLLDLDQPLDQAQGMWFLRECFTLRRDLAIRWLEPALPRISQLLVGDDRQVREQAIGLLAAIAPADLEAPTVDASTDELTEFAKQAAHEMFPPIRQVSEGLLALFPGPERDALAAAGKQALLAGIGEATYGKTGDGLPYRGFRVDRVPDELAILAIPRGAIITAVNGVPVNDGRQLIDVVASLFVMNDEHGKPQQISRRVLVAEYLHEGQTKAVEYRIF